MTGRPAVAAQIDGHEFQHLVTWCECLRAIRPGADVVAMTVEARDAGNVDDVVIERRTKPTRYLQVKHAVDAKTPVGNAWLTDADPTSLLQRFYRSWSELRNAAGNPAMELITDREIDPNDPLMCLLDRHSELLVPAIAGPGARSRVGKARKAWSKHVDVSEADLLAMLAALRFRTGRALQMERERAADLLFGQGFEYDDTAILRGVDAVRSWIRQHARRLELDDIRALVEGATTSIANPTAVLVVEAIDDDPHPEDATKHLRWVDLFDGDDGMTRRDLRNPDDWQRVIAPDLERAAAELKALGYGSVLVRGPMRQAVLFGVGAALREVKGFSLNYRQRGQIWDSETVGSPQEIATGFVEVGQGPDLALVVSVATDASDAVVRYVEEAGLPVNRVVLLSPASGIGDRSAPDGPTAVAIATALRNRARRALEDTPTDDIHLFLAAPGGLALLLGHRWNALRPTVVYEHLGVGRGYSPTLTIAS